MKKIFVTILPCIVCCALAAACGGETPEKNADFKPQNGYCVVSVPQDFGIVLESAGAAQLDYNLINAETVDGVPKKEYTSYFCIPENEPFRISTPPVVIQKKNTERLTLTGWSLNGENYSDCDGNLSKNVFCCDENTEILPVYTEFKAVGLILYLTGDGFTPQYDIFDDSGNIAESEDVGYLYGAYDFTPRTELWKTNLDTEYLSCSAQISGQQKTYTVSTKIDLTSYVKKGKIAVKSLCRIKGGGFMIDPTASTQIISGADLSMEGTFTIPLEQNSLKCTFSINM